MSEGCFPTNQWEEWGRDFESIRTSLVSLGEKRAIHIAHREVLAHHKVDDFTSIVHHWMQENYAESMLMGLRRLIDKGFRNRNTFSLVTLLEDIKNKSSEITLDKYVEMGHRAQTSSPDSFLRKLYARFSSDGSTLDSEKISSDIRSSIQRYRGHPDLYRQGNRA
jgi:hypothetical protein